MSSISPNLYRRLTFLIGLFPPAYRSGSTALYPLFRWLLVLALLGGLCSSMTSTMSSSLSTRSTRSTRSTMTGCGCGGGLLSTMIGSRLDSLLGGGGLRERLDSIISERERDERLGERALDRVITSSPTISPPPPILEQV